MRKIDELREAVPELKQYSDGELVKELYEKHGEAKTYDEFARDLGVEINRGGGSGAFNSGVAGATDALTFGLSDEILGAADTVFRDKVMPWDDKWSKTYRGRQQDREQYQNTQKDARPWSHTAGAIGASIPMIALGRGPAAGIMPTGTSKLGQEAISASMIGGIDSGSRSVQAGNDAVDVAIDSILGAVVGGTTTYGGSKVLGGIRDVGGKGLQIAGQAIKKGGEMLPKIPGKMAKSALAKSIIGDLAEEAGNALDRSFYRFLINKGQLDIEGTRTLFTNELGNPKNRWNVFRALKFQGEQLVNNRVEGYLTKLIPMYMPGQKVSKEIMSKAKTLARKDVDKLFNKLSFALVGKGGPKHAGNIKNESETILNEFTEQDYRKAMLQYFNDSMKPRLATNIMQQRLLRDAGMKREKLYTGQRPGSIHNFYRWRFPGNPMPTIPGSEETVKPILKGGSKLGAGIYENVGEGAGTMLQALDVPLGLASYGATGIPLTPGLALNLTSWAMRKSGKALGATGKVVQGLADPSSVAKDVGQAGEKMAKVVHRGVRRLLRQPEETVREVNKMDHKIGAMLTKTLEQGPQVYKAAIWKLSQNADQRGLLEAIGLLPERTNQPNDSQF